MKNFTRIFQSKHYIKITSKQTKTLYIIIIYYKNFPRNLQLITNRNPIISQVISSCKNFAIFSIWYQSFDHLIQLFRLLALTSALGKDDIGQYVTDHSRRIHSLLTDETRLLGVLQVEPMTLGHTSIYRCFYPCYIIN